MKIMIGLLLTPWTMMLRGFVLVKLWHWFIVPLGVVELRIPTALGIAVIVSLLTTDYGVIREKREWWEDMFYSTGLSLFAFGFGWIYQLWI